MTSSKLFGIFDTNDQNRIKKRRQKKTEPIRPGDIVETIRNFRHKQPKPHLKMTIEKDGTDKTCKSKNTEGLPCVWCWKLARADVKFSIVRFRFTLSASRFPLSFGLFHFHLEIVSRCVCSKKPQHVVSVPRV